LNQIVCARGPSTTSRLGTVRLRKLLSINLMPRAFSAAT
jgi:hypothetical protein